MTGHSSLSFLLWLFLFLSLGAPVTRGQNSGHFKTIADKIQADSDLVKADWSIGFDNAIPSSGGFPLLIEVRNLSGRTLSGQFEILFFNGWQARPEKTIRSPYQLGAGSRQRFSYAVSNDQRRSGPPHAIGVRMLEGNKTIWGQARELNLTMLRAHSGQSLNVLMIDPLRKPPVRFRNQSSNKNIESNGLPPKKGRSPIRSLVIRDAAIPDQPHTLFHLNGIVLSADVRFQSLAAAQLKSLTHYLLHGGTVFLPESKREWLDHWIKKAPFKRPDPSAKETAVGAGLLVFYSPEGAADISGEEPQRLYSILDARSNRHFSIYQQEQSGWMMPSGIPGNQTAKSLMGLGLFFLAYMVFTGPALLLFRKWKRPGILKVLGGLITAFIILSALLGLSLRFIKGDLGWTTLTEVNSDGGATQKAVLSLKSAGGRNHDLALSPEVWLHSYKPGGSHQLDYLQKPPEGTASLRIIPWTTSTVFSQSEVSDQIKPLTFHRVKPVAHRNQTKYLSVEIEASNPNDFEIRHPFLFFSAIGDANFLTKTKSYRKSEKNASFVLRTKFSTPFPARAKEVTFTSKGSNWERDRHPGTLPLGLFFHPIRERKPPAASAYIQLPNHGRRGVTEAIFVGVIEESPGIEIQPSSDFVFDQGQHYFVQRLRPEDLGQFDQLIPEAPES